MAQVIISKHKFRKGTNDQRKTIIFDQGEPAYTIDTRRLYLGTGTLSGGNVVGSKIHPILSNFYSLSTTIAELGDLVLANNKYYQLTAVDYTNVDSWADVGPRLNTTFFQYTSSNLISLNLSSIPSVYLNPSTIGNGLKIDSNILQLDFNTVSLELSSNKLSIKAAGITEREISSTALSSGLTGGSGSKIRLDVDPTYFVFVGNQLSLSASPASIDFFDLDSNWFGAGLIYDSGDTHIRARLTDVDNTTISKTVSGVISQTNIGAAATEEWSKITVDTYGRVTQTDSAIYDILSGNSALGWENGTNTLSSLFNGSPNGIFTGGELTKFTVLSTNGSNNAILTLSSAGFIVFEGGTTTRTGKTVNRFAIPIFTF